MLERLKHIFALSDKGAKDMVKAFIACILHNISLMVPVVLLYSFISDLLPVFSARSMQNCSEKICMGRMLPWPDFSLERK